MGLRDAEQDEHGIVLATIPATANHTRSDHRLDRPRRYVAGNQRPQRQAGRSCALRRPRHCLARRSVTDHSRRRQSGAGESQRQDAHHHRRHNAARRRRQGRRGRHHGGGGATAGPAGNAARPDPRLLHLRRRDRPRRRSPRSEETRRPRRLHARRRRRRARSTAKPSPPTWPS